MVKREKITTVIFDFFDVITHDSYLEAQKYFVEKSSRMSAERFRNIVKYHKGQDFWWKFTTGRISEREYWGYVDKNLKNTKKLLEIRSIVYDFMFPKKGTVEIINNLGDKYKLGMITNHTKEFYNHFLHTEHGRNIINKFDVIVNSAHVGLKKPDKRIFEIAVARLKVDPSESVFIDDRVDYVNAAKQLGIAGIVFANSVQTKKELSRLGVIV